MVRSTSTAACASTASRKVPITHTPHTLTRARARQPPPRPLQVHGRSPTAAPSPLHTPRRSNGRRTEPQSGVHRERGVTGPKFRVRGGALSPELCRPSVRTRFIPATCGHITARHLATRWRSTRSSIVHEWNVESHSPASPRNEFRLLSFDCGCNGCNIAL